MESCSLFTRMVVLGTALLYEGYATFGRHFLIVPVAGSEVLEACVFFGMLLLIFGEFFVLCSYWLLQR